MNTGDQFLFLLLISPKPLTYGLYVLFFLKQGEEISSNMRNKYQLSTDISKLPESIDNPDA